MYHEHVAVTVLSTTSDIQACLEQGIARDLMHCHIQTSGAHGAWHSSDIILCELSLSSLQPIRSRMREDAYLLYICDADAASCADCWDVADEVICRPLSMAYLEKRIRCLYECYRQKERAWLLDTYLNTLIDSMPDLVWFKDEEGSHVKVNSAFCHTVGKSRMEIEGKNHCAMWDVDVDDCAETEDIVRREKKTCQFNELVKSPHGLRQFRTYKSPLFDKQNRIIGSVGIGHDITDLENMSTELEILLNSMPFAILIRDQAGTVLNVNDKFTEFFAVSRASILDVAYDDWFSSLLREGKQLKKESNGKAILTFEGNRRILEISNETIYDIFKSRVGDLCIYRDMTEEYLLEQQLSSNSNTDYLTGLYNRRYFYEYYADLRKFKQISILYVDLDYFKTVNDTYGHQVGDEALRISAEVLKKMFPKDLIARLGGDEFLVSMTASMSAQELLRQGNRLIHELQKHFERNAYYMNLSASVGISYTTDPVMRIDDLIRESDTALYKAKQQGRSKCQLYERAASNTRYLKKAIR